MDKSENGGIFMKDKQEKNQQPDDFDTINFSEEITAPGFGVNPTGPDEPEIKQPGKDPIDQPEAPKVENKPFEEPTIPDISKDPIDHPTAPEIKEPGDIPEQTVEEEKRK